MKIDSGKAKELIKKLIFNYSNDSKMLKYQPLSFILLFICLISCGRFNMQNSNEGERLRTFRYLALGDSYTIGTAIDQEKTYASLIAKALQRDLPRMKVQLEVIAANGWTSGILISALEKNSIKDSIDLVSVLIGVNNQFQGRSAEEYQKHLVNLVGRAIKMVGERKERVLVISIPDYGVTPFGIGNQSKINHDIELFNRINKEVADSMNVSYVSITEISRTALDNPALVSSDGLHFSEEMHKKWFEIIYPSVMAAVN